MYDFLLQAYLLAGFFVLSECFSRAIFSAGHFLIYWTWKTGLVTVNHSRLELAVLTSPAFTIQVADTG